MPLISDDRCNDQYILSVGCLDLRAFFHENTGFDPVAVSIEPETAIGISQVKIPVALECSGPVTGKNLRDTLIEYFVRYIQCRGHQAAHIHSAVLTENETVLIDEIHLPVCRQ